MNSHFEAQTVLESLYWLRENRTQIDLPAALLILAAEEPWGVVMDAAKARTTAVAKAAEPTPVLAGSAAQGIKKLVKAVLASKVAAVVPAGTSEAKPAPLKPAVDTRPLQPPRRRLAGM